MRLIIGSLIVAASAVIVSAQGATAPSPAAKVHDETKAKVIAELAAAGLRSGFKNSPLSAEEVNESVQTLADGNRIVRSTTGKYYRNSEGRVRRENPGSVGGMMGSLYTTGQGVSIASPTLNQKYLLDTELKTARVLETVPDHGVSIVSAKPLTDEDKIKIETKLRTELKGNLKLDVPMAVTPAIAPIVGGGGGGFAYTVSGQHTKYETRTEELGTRDFDGVSAEGTRKTTIIPAGAIGNERPIEVVYERWFSKELGLVVYSKNTDPRFGEQTYKLINVVRSEPDPSLFSLPTGYKVISDASPAYRTSSTRATEVERATSPRAAVRATPVSYKVSPEAKPVPAVEKIKP